MAEDNNNVEDNEKFGKWNFDQFDHMVTYTIYESVTMKEEALIGKGITITPELEDSLKVRFTKEEYESYMKIYGEEVFKRYLLRTVKIPEDSIKYYNGLNYSDYNARISYEIASETGKQTWNVEHEQKEYINQYNKGTTNSLLIVLWGIPCGILACMAMGITGIIIVIIVCIIVGVKTAKKPDVPKCFVPNPAIGEKAFQIARTNIYKLHAGDPVFERYWQDRLEMEREGRQ